jgi:hypothetical protein
MAEAMAPINDHFQRKRQLDYKRYKCLLASQQVSIRRCNAKTRSFL